MQLAKLKMVKADCSLADPTGGMGGLSSSRTGRDGGGIVAELRMRQLYNERPLEGYKLVHKNKRKEDGEKGTIPDRGL